MLVALRRKEVTESSCRSENAGIHYATGMEGALTGPWQNRILPILPFTQSDTVLLHRLDGRKLPFDLADKVVVIKRFGQEVVAHAGGGGHIGVVARHEDDADACGVGIGLELFAKFPTVLVADKDIHEDEGWLMDPDLAFRFFDRAGQYYFIALSFENDLSNQQQILVIVQQQNLFLHNYGFVVAPVYSNTFPKMSNE